MLVSCFVNERSKSGLLESDHMWNFLMDNLNPSNPHMETLLNSKVYALSTDLEEATDYGNPSVSA